VHYFDGSGEYDGCYGLAQFATEKAAQKCAKGEGRPEKGYTAKVVPCKRVPEAPLL
jgi:hypothetical protein